MQIKVNVSGAVQSRIDALKDDAVMKAVHNTLAKMCDPYVPMDEGILATTLEITPEYLRYVSPYAHYMYMGIVYGPNIPIKDEMGEIVGWYSIPGRTKEPTGRPIQYSTEKHPLATKEWDKVMLRDKGDEFKEQIRQILIRKAREV